MLINAPVSYLKKYIWSLHMLCKSLPYKRAQEFFESNERHFLRPQPYQQF